MTSGTKPIRMTIQTRATKAGKAMRSHGCRVAKRRPECGRAGRSATGGKAAESDDGHPPETILKRQAATRSVAYQPEAARGQTTISDPSKPPRLIERS